MVKLVIAVFSIVMLSEYATNAFTLGHKYTSRSSSMRSLRMSDDEYTIGILGDLHLDPRFMDDHLEGREHFEPIFNGGTRSNSVVVSLGDLGESKPGYIPTHLPYIPTYLHTYTPTYLHTYTPTHVHIYTYTHTYAPTYLHCLIHTLTLAQNVISTHPNQWSKDLLSCLPAQQHAMNLQETISKVLPYRSTIS